MSDIYCQAFDEMLYLVIFNCRLKPFKTILKYSKFCCKISCFLFGFLWNRCNVVGMKDKGNRT